MLKESDKDDDGVDEIVCATETEELTDACSVLDLDRDFVGGFLYDFDSVFLVQESLRETVCEGKADAVDESVDDRVAEDVTDSEKLGLPVAVLPGENVSVAEDSCDKEAEMVRSSVFVSAVLENDRVPLSVSVCDSVGVELQVF